MGYRSSVAIAITEELYTACVADGSLPQLIKDDLPKFCDGNVYWYIDSIKWYTMCDHDVELCEKWFNMCCETHECSFAAILIGEEIGDSESWGDTYEMGIGIEWSITLPFNK